MITVTICAILYIMIHTDHKYIRLLSTQLSHFKKKSDGLYNFRCPICGDSQKNKFKARGYVFRLKESLVFKCHNCGDSRSLGKLIQHVSPTMYGQYVVESYGSKEDKKSKPKDPEFNFKSDVSFPKNMPSKMFEDVGAVRLSTLPSDHPANVFVKSRKLPHDKTRRLYYIDDEEKLEKISPKYEDRIAGHCPRLLLPFCDTEGNLIGVTGRALESSGLRYLTLRLTEENGPMIFGIENWDKNKHTYVVEGPLDSMFLPNCLAVGGSDFAKIARLVNQNYATIVLDNEPRNKEIIRHMKGMITMGWKVCIWPENISEKDINDMVIAGQGPDKILSLINKNSLAGLKAEFKLNQWKKC